MWAIFLKAGGWRSYEYRRSPAVGSSFALDDCCEFPHPCGHRHPDSHGAPTVVLGRSRQRPRAWDQTTTFSNVAGAPISADRTYEIFNQNGWGRSLHFLAAWFLVITSFVYVLTGLFGGHIRRNILPRAKDLAPGALVQDARDHLRPGDDVGGGPPYGAVQKAAYSGVVFVALPLMLITGLTMSPAVSASLPFLLDVFGGYQSARTIHFFCFSALILFLIVHVAMVFVTGAGRQLRAMILGK